MALTDVLSGGLSGQAEGEGIDFFDPFDISGRGAAASAERAAGLQAGAITESARIAAASQERGLQALLEQLGITREGFAPFLEAGTGALPELAEGFRPTRGATAGGLEANLAEIFGGDAFQSLVGERQRGAQGQLAAGGLTRSGTGLMEAARIPTELGFDIENLLFGRGQQQEISRIQGLQNLVGTGLSAAGQTAGAGGSLTSQIVNQLSNIGMAQGQGITGAAQATAAGILGGAQSQAQGRQNALNIGGSLLSYFSDPRLKKDIKVVRKVGPLDLITWNWIDELKDSFVSAFPKIGWLSSQVKEHYPQFVGEFAGYDIVDYKGLRKELENG